MAQPKPPLADELDPAGTPDLEPIATPPESLGLDDFEESEPGPGAAAESRKLSDMLRKAMVAGLGAVFMTEEGIRAYVKDLKLPKDVMGFVVGQAERSKGELFRVIGDELRRFFESELLRRELVRLLSQMTVEVHAEIRLKPDGSPEVKVQSTTARRPAKKKG